MLPGIFLDVAASRVTRDAQEPLYLATLQWLALNYLCRQ